MQTVLTHEQTDALVERLARWAASLGIGSLVAFMLEVNRPVAPLTGNACIALGTFADGISPIPLHALGLLLQDRPALERLCNRLRELEAETANERERNRE
jgi:hypothetical protein